MATLTGSCLCGAVSFETRAEPPFIGHCHCRDCQKVGGAGHSSYAFFPAEAVQVEGDTRGFDVNADSGATMTRYFCPQCGSRLFGRSSRLPDFFGIMLTAFDEPDAFTPTISLFTASRRRWDTVAPDTRAFEEDVPRRG